jgi:uncharacterized sodium:solute symporter family permease YidK
MVCDSTRGYSSEAHQRSRALKENTMGYGFGGFLVVVGLVLALAVTDTINGVDLTAVGWIMTLVGVATLALTAVTWNRTRGGAHSMTTTTHADGSQSVSERRTDI